MEKYELTSRRYDVEQAQRWQDEVDRLPWIQFPSDWKVKMIPPHGDAVVRFLVTLPDGKEKSVYYDSRSSLGYYFDDRGERIPYWEVYPVNGDVGRCGTDEVELLLEMIAEVSEEKEEADVSEWITDRSPKACDADITGFVWITTEYGAVLREQWKTVRERPWMPITPPEPYVKPKRYAIRCYGDFGFVGPAGFWCVYDTVAEKEVTCFMPREAAERIAKAFEEEKP